ncbi:MAG: GNAT family N-acetyltransferase [Gemmatimonas sp.]
MSSPDPDAVLPLPPALEDGVIALQLLHLVGPGDASARPIAAQFLANALEYRFAILRASDGLRVGWIYLRITQDDVIVRAIGHAGYGVDAAHQRRGYATRAVRLIQQLAHDHALSPLWILIAPENVASRRTVERVGFQLVDIVDASPEALAMESVPTVCRYRWDDRPHSL